MGNFHINAIPFGIFGFVYNIIFFGFCFDLGFYLPWDISQMQQLYPRMC